jgi:hypothetical protein
MRELSTAEWSDSAKKVDNSLFYFEGEKNENEESAFPQMTWERAGDDKLGFYTNGGMGLRDWLAGMALEGVMKTYKWFTFKDVAELAYELADAMMKERGGWLKKRKPPL